MKSRSYPFIAYFFLLPILQMIVFNQFGLGSQLVPHVTLLFLIFYPTDSDQTLYLLVAFLYGLYLDILHSTMGLHGDPLLNAGCLSKGHKERLLKDKGFGRNP